MKKYTAQQNCFRTLIFIYHVFTHFFHTLLQDDDPYVRKTAAVSVAKLHDINGRLVEEQGFIELLKVGKQSIRFAFD